MSKKRIVKPEERFATKLSKEIVFKLTKGASSPEIALVAAPIPATIFFEEEEALVDAKKILFFLYRGIPSKTYEILLKLIAESAKEKGEILREIEKELK